MGIWGVDYYGGTRFGRDPLQVRPDFSAGPFTCVPITYGTFFLTWDLPQSTDCNRLRLVRNQWSLPENENDGFILVDAVMPGAPKSLLDTEVPPDFSYFSIFGYDKVNNIWIRSADLVAMMPINWGYSVKGYNLLPAMYRDRDFYVIDALNPDPNSSSAEVPPLQRFWQLIGFQLDFIRTYAESLLQVNNPDHVSGVWLPQLAFQFGIPYESELGMKRTRDFISNIVHLYKIKGTLQGISELVSVLTGWAVAEVYQGFNKLLSLDDSVMKNSVGTWQFVPPVLPAAGVTSPPPGLNQWSGGSVVDATLIPIPDLTAPPASTPNPVTNLGFTPTGYTNSGMRISTSGTAGTVSLTTGAIPLTAFQKPNQASAELTFQFQFFTPVGTPARTVTLMVLDELGNIVAPTTFPANVSVSGSWVTMTWVASPLTGVVGNYVYPYIRLTMGANESHYMTLVGMWSVDVSDIGDLSLNIPSFDYPREIKIYLAPDRVNLLGNTLTTFSNGLDGWSASLNPTDPAEAVSGKLNVVYIPSGGDPNGLYSINGVGSMSFKGAGFPVVTVYGGAVSAVSTVIPASGWILGNDWLGGAGTNYNTPRTWFSDAGSPWWMMSGGFFGSGATFSGGDWFPPNPPAQVATIHLPVPQLNTFYTYSVYVRSLSNNPGATTAYPGIWWRYPDGTTAFSRGQGQTITTTGFTRVWASFQPPLKNGVLPTGMLGQLEFLGTPINSEWWLNSAMLEPSPIISPFFDANQFSGTSEYFHDTFGSSYFYARRAPKVFRLNYWLPFFIPMGLTYSLFFSASEDSSASPDPSLV